MLHKGVIDGRGESKGTGGGIASPRNDFAMKGQN